MRTVRAPRLTGVADATTCHFRTNGQLCILHAMDVRRLRRSRGIAALALLAMLLLAVVPTVSRVLAAHAAASMAAAGQHHPAHHHPAAGQGLHAGHADGEGLDACGYCDFLGHSPAAGLAVPFVLVAIRRDAPAAVGDHCPPRLARAWRAQPRGPPHLPA
jgi:hypothetical protein